MPVDAGGFQYQVVGDSESPEQMQFSVDGARSTLVIEVDLGDSYELELAIADILGYSYRNPSRTSKLSREIPWKHPMFPWMVCTQIVSIQGRGQPTKERGRGGYYPSYPQYRMVLGFETPMYTVMDDNEVGDSAGCEFNRFVVEDGDYGTEILTRRGACYKWARVQPSQHSWGTTTEEQTLNNGFPIGVDRRSPVDVGIALRIPKHTFKWVWKGVPRVGLFGSTGTGLPENLVGGLSRVNSATFAGYPAGTLLLIGAKPKPLASPIYPSATIGGAYPRPPRIYDVEYTVQYLDPPYDGEWSAAGAYPFRGHNLCPLPPTTNGDLRPYWYLITSDIAGSGTADRYRRYQSYDYTKLFTLL